MWHCEGGRTAEAGPDTCIFHEDGTGLTSPAFSSYRMNGWPWAEHATRAKVDWNYKRQSGGRRASGRVLEAHRKPNKIASLGTSVAGAIQSCHKVISMRTAAASATKSNFGGSCLTEACLSITMYAFARWLRDPAQDGGLMLQGIIQPVPFPAKYYNLRKQVTYESGGRGKVKTT